MKIDRPISSQPLPDDAQLVFKGVLFDVYQWQQRMFDGTTATFEKLKRPDTVIVFAVLDDDRILLTKQEQPGKQPFIGAAGGRVDEGEDILTAVKRELLEETGYEADDWTLWHSEQPISKIEWASYVFIAKKVRKVAELNLDSGEKIELMPVMFDELITIGTSSKLSAGFYEKEIVHHLYEAKLDPAKYETLKKLFSN